MSTTSRPGDGWHNVFTEFRDAAIDVSPLQPYVAGLVKLDDWQWGTEEFDRGDHYMFDPALDSLLQGSLPARGCPSLQVSHAGHGVNSYGITLQVVTPTCIALAQAGWGGGYMDNTVAARAVEAMFASVAAFIEQSHNTGKAGEGRAVLALSDFRSYHAAGHIAEPRPGPIDVREWLKLNECEAPAWMQHDFFGSIAETTTANTRQSLEGTS